MKHRWHNVGLPEIIDRCEYCGMHRSLAFVKGSKTGREKEMVEYTDFAGKVIQEPRYASSASVPECGGIVE